MDKKHCKGCVDDFYNNKNPYGILQCAHLETARLVERKKVPIDQKPPWTQNPVTVPDCRREKGVIYVKRDRMY